MASRESGTSRTRPRFLKQTAHIVKLFQSEYQTLR